MKDLGKRISAFTLVVVIAFAVIVPGLHAGFSSGGKFTLPFNAQWEKIDLPTGDYTYSIDHLSLGGTIIVYQGSQAIGTLRPQVFESTQGQGKNPALICIRHNGNVTVRALRLPHTGTFYFSLPKELKGLMAQQPKLIETVSVEVTGQ
jgi:hypothetical protein